MQFVHWCSDYVRLILRDGLGTCFYAYCRHNYRGKIVGHFQWIADLEECLSAWDKDLRARKEMNVKDSAQSVQTKLLCVIRFSFFVLCPVPRVVASLVWRLYYSANQLLWIRFDWDEPVWSGSDSDWALVPSLRKFHNNERSLAGESELSRMRVLTDNYRQFRTNCWWSDKEIRLFHFSVPREWRNSSQ